jgi:hypothetical protein
MQLVQHKRKVDTMSCKKFEENISAYFDGELDKSSQNSVLDHTKNCELCGFYFKQFNMLQNKMNLQLAPIEAPAFIENQLMQRIASERNSKQKAPVWEIIRTRVDEFVFRTKSAVRIVEFAVVCLIAIFAGFQLYTNFGPNKKLSSEIMDEHIQPIFSNEFVQNDLEDYFTKSSHVLQQIKSSKISDSTQFVSERKMANELLVKSQLISHKLHRENQKQTTDLLQDLEPLFIDLAQYDRKRDRRSVDVWKSTIDNNNYISRINTAKIQQANYNR